MQDIDKFPPIIQWVMGVGLLIGGILAGWFGSRKSKLGDNPDEEDRNLAREERARLLVLQNQVAEERMRRDWEAALKATRQSFYDQSEKLTRKFESELNQLEIRVRELERELPRRSPPHR